MHSSDCEGIRVLFTQNDHYNDREVINLDLGSYFNDIKTSEIPSQPFVLTKDNVNQQDYDYLQENKSKLVEIWKSMTHRLRHVGTRCNKSTIKSPCDENVENQLSVSYISDLQFGSFMEEWKLEEKKRETTTNCSGTCINRVRKLFLRSSPMAIICIIQIIVFIVETESIKQELIYNPSKKIQIWRYFTYSLIHSDKTHLFWNVLFQVIFGTPLAFYYPWKAEIVYCFGIVAGALGSSVIESDTLCGASGGVCALITSCVIASSMNWKNYCARGSFLFLSFMIIAWLLSFGKNCCSDKLDSTVSHFLHVFGGLAGLFIGFGVFKNFVFKNTKEKVVNFILLSFAIIPLIAAIIYNIAVTPDKVTK